MGVFTGKEGEPDLVKFVCGMARPELRAKEKGEHDTGKAGDVGRTRVLLFCRKFLTDAASVTCGGCNVERGSVSLEIFAVSRERKLDEIARRKAHKEIATGAINIGQAHGVELHLRLITAMLGETLREIQQRNCGGSGAPAVARSEKTK